MTDTIYLVLYGLLFLSGLFMFPAWSAVAAGAARDKDRKTRNIAWFLMLNSIGTVIVFGVRLLYGFDTGNWRSLGGAYGAAILVGLGLFEASKVGLLWEARAGRMAKGWRWFSALSAAWAAFAVGWMVL